VLEFDARLMDRGLANFDNQCVINRVRSAWRSVGAGERARLPGPAEHSENRWSRREATDAVPRPGSVFSTDSCLTGICVCYP